MSMLGFTQYGDEIAKYANMPAKEIAAGILGKRGSSPIQYGAAKDVRWLGNKIPGVSPGMAAKAGRFAGKAVPLLSVVSNVTDVADIIGGNESLGNKVMDGAAMATGAAIGGVLGAGVFSPLTASIGASVGKMASDATQWVFGDKKSPEQRKIEQVLAAQQGRYI